VDPFAIRDGMLTITAAPGTNPLGLAYNSGAITTAQSFGQQYGFFEVRAQVPAGQGFWPAFWLLPVNSAWPPEIDIFEVLGNAPSVLYASLHSNTSADVSQKVSTSIDLSKAFHTYALDWRADRITWYLDGNIIAQAATPADMKQPMYMVLNLAVGDTGSWPGKYAASKPTAKMLVDYVHVWQDGAGAGLASVVRGPADADEFGGRYALAADGLSDSYDFSASVVRLRMDAADLSTTVTHRVTATRLGDEVHAGAGTLNADLGAGNDTFWFGTAASRLYGGPGDDLFVFDRAAMSKGANILDFHTASGTGTEHDVLRFEGFSPGARLEYVKTAGTAQYYRVVDGSYLSPTIIVVVENSADRLAAADYVFA
jgi:hypothetical protein